jgi:hypothetical protein
MTSFVFTMTAGRTGTAWLAKLFAANFDCMARHEYLGFGEFGIYSQDVGLMGAFNHWGNKERVQNFWRRKFSLIPKCSMYVETNHALGKCGLIENLSMLPDDAEVSIVTLRRNWVSQAVSYLTRYDFENMSTVWLWYLDAQYQNNIVSPKPFKDLGTLGYIIWYIAEVEARQAYYRLRFGDHYRFLDAPLEDVTTHAGAQRLLKAFGHTGPVTLPEKANANPKTVSPDVEDQIQGLVSRIRFDPAAVAQDYIDSGRRLDVRKEAQKSEL